MSELLYHSLMQQLRRNFALSEQTEESVNALSEGVLSSNPHILASVGLEHIISKKLLFSGTPSRYLRTQALNIASGE